MNVSRQVLSGLALAALGAACAGSRPAPPVAAERFRDAYAEGRLADATQAFESDPRLRFDFELAYRAGLAWAHPSHPARDPARARELLEFVATRDTSALLAGDAASVLALLDAERDQRILAVELRRELDALKEIDLQEGVSVPADTASAPPP